MSWIHLEAGSSVDAVSPIMVTPCCLGSWSNFLSSPAHLFSSQSAESRRTKEVKAHKIYYPLKVLDPLEAGSSLDFYHGDSLSCCFLVQIFFLLLLLFSLHPHGQLQLDTKIQGISPDLGPQPHQLCQKNFLVPFISFLFGFNPFFPTNFDFNFILFFSFLFSVRHRQLIFRSPMAGL